jgi:cytochrome P450
MFRAQGYKVIELPFKPLGAPCFEMIAKDTE